MRHIYPDQKATQELFNKNDNRATKEDINQLSVRIDNTIQQLENLAASLQSYKDDMQESVNTNQITAINAAITSLQTTESNLGDVEAENITVDSLAQITNLVAQIGTFTTDLTSPNATITDLSAVKAEVGNLKCLSIEATAADIESWSITNLTVTDLNVADKIESNDIETETATFGAATIENDLDVNGDISATNVEADKATVSLIESEEIATENIHWDGTTNVFDVDDFVLEIPHFENGQYYLFIKKNNELFAAIEIFNSVDNYFVRWSQETAGNIQKIYKYEAGVASKLYIELHSDVVATFNINYATVCATPNVSGPASYSEIPVTPDVTYEVQYKDGSKFFKNVDLAQSGGTIGTLTQLTSDNIANATNDVLYDTAENATIIVYKPDQSLNTDDDVAFHEVDTTFLNVRDFSTRNFIATELRTVSSIDLTKFDDGSIIVVRVGSTAASNQPSAAYIKQTDNGVPVLYDIIKGKNLPATTTNHPLVWDPTTRSIKESTTLAVEEVTVEDAEVDDLVVNNDTIIHGDLYVDGTTHTVSEEQANTTSDTLTLRQNNNTSLGGNHSGIIINKYDGVNDLALVTDSDGTLQVGTGTGTNTTYSDIYWDDTTSKWYSDAALTTEVTPTGILTAWASVEEISNVKHYTNAVFTAINYSNLVPLLGRDAASNLSNRGLLSWDSANEIAKTTAAPTADGQVLVNRVSGGVSSYNWEITPKNFVFATMADYTAAAADVPNGSIVIITGENNYLEGDNI